MNTLAALRRLVPALLVACASPCLGDQVFVGQTGGYAGVLNLTAVTVIQRDRGAPTDGLLVSATFGWSNSPCPGAVKIKFFRPNPSSPNLAFDFLTERGPFSVTAPLTVPSASDPPVRQTVPLDPPVPVQIGDVIAIANLTTCGGPTIVPDSGPNSVPDSPALFLPPPLGSLVFSGDVTGNVVGSSDRAESGIDLIAVGTSTSVVLLAQFNVALFATDPRTRQQTVGAPVRLPASSSSTAAAYFSLPDFTGDPLFPEVVVKMVNAIGFPSLGNSVWFFHAPLTDVQYTITVTNLNDRTVRTYMNSSGSPGQLCGGVDTSAFGPR